MLNLFKATSLALIAITNFSYVNITLADETTPTGLTLTMGTSNGPPYMIQKTESGLDIDIPRAAMAKIGFPLRLEFYPLSRAIHELQLNRIHLTAPFFTSAPKGIFVSDSHIEYRPSVITLTSIDTLKNIAELKDYTIATFQGATGYFGDEFYYASKKAPDYVEFHDMEKLIDILMSQRYQVVVLDYWIFRFFLANSEYADQLDQVRFHELLPRVPAAVAFNNKELRDKFNKGLRMIKEDGSYDAIINRYQRNE
ncbi:MAG: transporter substrate-binding domain-containing protein [Oleispira sp.]